jgi:hypothetical protein
MCGEGEERGSEKEAKVFGSPLSCFHCAISSFLLPLRQFFNVFLLRVFILRKSFVAMKTNHEWKGKKEVGMNAWARVTRAELI